MQKMQSAAPRSASHAPSDDLRWPSCAQLAATKPDTRLHVGKAATTESSLLQKGEGV